MEYKTGCMPHTDFKYEEFEGLLGSYYLSLLPLKDSKKPEDQRDYQTVLQILQGFSERYGVQSPEDAVKNPRSNEIWGNAKLYTNISLMSVFRSFIVDFGVGNEPHTIDREERSKLGRTILGVFDRYGIAKIAFQDYKGEKLPLKVETWNDEKASKNLADIIKE